MDPRDDPRDDPRVLWLTHLPREVLAHILSQHVPPEDHACVARACRELEAALDGRGACPRFRTRVFASRRRCEWAYAEGWRPGAEASFRGAVESGDLELLEHVWEVHVASGTHGRLRFLAHAYRHACTHGHLAMMEWMERRVGLSIHHVAQECILCAAIGGHVEVAEWVFQRVPWMTTSHLDDALVASVRHGHRPMIQWLFERPAGSPHLHLATRQAAFYAKRAVLQWLMDRYPLWALLRDPDHTSFHVSATFIRAFLLRSRDADLLRRGVEWGVFATLDPEYLHACVYDFFELSPAHELLDMHGIHDWIDDTAFTTGPPR